MGGATPIPNSYMTASSYWGAKYEPYQGRLNNVEAWTTSTAEKDAAIPSMWLQVIITVYCI